MCLNNEIVGALNLKNEKDAREINDVYKKISGKDCGVWLLWEAERQSESEK